MLLPDDRRAPPYREPARNGFCPLALEDWIEAAARADVPHVPARRLAVFEKSDLRHHEIDGPHQARLDAAFEQLHKRRRCRTMVRWDCCAPGWLKAELSDGNWPKTSDPRFSHLPVDARLLTALEDYPRILVPAWERPWLGRRTIQFDGWPVEYRAFIENAEVVGISSYYPQRDLRASAEELHAVAQLSGRLARAITGRIEWPVVEDERLRARNMMKELAPDRAPADAPSPDVLHATADFVATTRGVLFLEGGPPWWMGAHPCCFPAERGRVHGVRLAAGADSAYRRPAK